MRCFMFEKSNSKRRNQYLLQLVCRQWQDALMKLQERLLIGTWRCTGTQSLNCFRDLVTFSLEGL